MKTRISCIAMLLALSMQGIATAQQTQTTAPSPPASGASTDTGKPFRATEVGDTTHYLLQLQTSGSQAGKPLPMLGDEATASYRRYLKSFEHPIPDFYDTLSKNDDTVK
jgi:hypothetical protein